MPNDPDWNALLEQTEEDVNREYQELFGGGKVDAPITQDIATIAQLLQANPLLVPPTLEYIQLKIAEINRQSLIVLYGEERYNQMVAKLHEADSAKETSEEGSESP